MENTYIDFVKLGWRKGQLAAIAEGLADHHFNIVMELAVRFTAGGNKNGKTLEDNLSDILQGRLLMDGQEIDLASLSPLVEYFRHNLEITGKAIFKAANAVRS